MEEIRIDSLAQLNEIFEKYGEGYTFRGQTNHYKQPNGEVSIASSFERHGCIPPTMIKWTHYAKAIIRALSNVSYDEISIGMSQAILQHYGWRSFYVDVTRDPQVACWFASNSCSSHKTISLCEDVDESPIHLIKTESRYEPNLGPGHIYIISIGALMLAGLEFHDLTQLSSPNSKLRFHAQSACLAGTKHGLLPPAAVVAHLIVDCELLTEYSKSRNAFSTADLFPDRSQDVVLSLLLSLPWVQVESEEPFPIPYFRRSIELPEYDAASKKHLGINDFLYSLYWISDRDHEGDETLRESTFVRLSEQAYFAHGLSDSYGQHELLTFINDRKRIFLELDSLIRIPEFSSRGEFEKGVMIENIGANQISIHGLLVEHAGHLPQGFGATLGWHYRFEGGQFVRARGAGDCPCNNNLRHELHLRVVRFFARCLKDGEVVGVSPHLFRQVDL